MTNYNFEITIKAESSQDAKSKLQSTVVLLAKLTTTELEKLADIVKNDPVKTALAKKALGV